MFSLLPEDPELSCPSCHRLMIPLREYHQVRDGGLFGGDSPLLLRSGRNAMLNPFAVVEFFNNIIDGLLNISRNSKGKRLCQEILPRYPRSQICTECLYVYKRE